MNQPLFFRRKKRGKIKGCLFLIILIILGVLFYYFYTINTAATRISKEKQITIQPGWGAKEITQELENQGIIKNSLIFQLYVWLKGINDNLLGGEYFLAQNLSIREIAKILTKGEGITKEKTIITIEGWSNKEVAEYLAKGGLVNQNDFFAVVQKKADWWDDYDFLDSRPKDIDLEGYLFPDTYRIYKDASATDIIKKMLDNFGRKLTLDLKAEIKKQNRSIHEIITLASILEKEVALEKDRKLVADIFYRRLALSMPLQADSTINYITGKKVTRASAEDIQIDNPYNTYKYKGLPPGPICNPGLEAILSAIYPTPNEYLYFLTTPDGEVIYSKTFEDHLKAKAEHY